MICHTITDELRQVAVNQKLASTGETAIMSLIKYANDVLNRIALRYSQVTPRILTEYSPWRMFARGGVVVSIASDAD